MAIPAALYYPHTSITDEKIIKNSLLLWDRVEYITPFDRRAHAQFESKYFNEAIEIISRPHNPIASEKEAVHKRIEDQINTGLPESFLLKEHPNGNRQPMYSIYPGKMAEKTWHLLEDRFLASLPDNESNYQLNYFLGLMLMSIIADVCAGETKRKITDEAAAYSFLQEFNIVEAGGNYIQGYDASAVTAEYGRLITLSLKVLDTDDIPVSDLVHMRRREEKGSNSDYRKFRRNYLSKLDEYVERIIKPGVTESDIKEYERQFEIDMEDELKDLRSELRVVGRKSLLSKEVLVAAAAIPGAMNTPIGGITDVAKIFGAIGIGALVKAGIEYNDARKKALKANAMSWLYLAENKATRFDPRNVIF